MKLTDRERKHLIINLAGQREAAIAAAALVSNDPVKRAVMIGNTWESNVAVVEQLIDLVDK